MWRTAGRRGRSAGRRERAPAAASAVRPRAGPALSSRRGGSGGTASRIACGARDLGALKPNVAAVACRLLGTESVQPSSAATATRAGGSTAAGPYAASTGPVGCHGSVEPAGAASAAGQGVASWCASSAASRGRAAATISSQSGRDRGRAGRRQQLRRHHRQHRQGRVAGQRAQGAPPLVDRRSRRLPGRRRGCRGQPVGQRGGQDRLQLRRSRLGQRASSRRHRRQIDAPAGRPPRRRVRRAGGVRVEGGDRVVHGLRQLPEPAQPVVEIGDHCGVQRRRPRRAGRPSYAPPTSVGTGASVLTAAEHARQPLPVGRRVASGTQLGSDERGERRVRDVGGRGVGDERRGLPLGQQHPGRRPARWWPPGGCGSPAAPAVAPSPAAASMAALARSARPVTRACTPSATSRSA